MSRTLTKQGEGLVLPWLLFSCRYLYWLSEQSELTKKSFRFRGFFRQ